MQSLLVLEDSVVVALLKDETIVSIVSCLGSPAAALKQISRGGTQCNKCNKAKQQDKVNIIKMAKICITKTNGTKLSQLKKSLNAKKLRLFIKNDKGKIVQYTI